MDVVFFGSGAFGLPTLEALTQRHRVRAIVTQPDRRAGRGKALTATPIGAWAAEKAPGVELLKPENVNEDGVRAHVRGLGAEAWVVIAFGQKLSSELLDGVFAVNLHASLLPRWRGAAPINWAVLAGDAETGNSVITLADRMDAGLVLGQSRRVIEAHQTAGELHDLMAADGPALVEEVLAGHATGTLSPVVQDESRVTLAKKLSSADRWVDFKERAEACRGRVHGLTPWPGVSVEIGGVRLKLTRVEAVAGGAESEVGRLVDAEAGVVSCGEGTGLRLIEVQPAGKRAMTWADFARGARLEAGMVVGGSA